MRWIKCDPISPDRDADHRAWSRNLANEPRKS
jgi:hypothetical protein